VEICFFNVRKVFLKIYGNSRETHGSSGKVHGNLGEMHGDLGEMHRDFGKVHGDMGEMHAKPPTRSPKRKKRCTVYSLIILYFDTTF
jgi:hypothetical protein